MKDIRTALRTILLADPAVNTLVGGQRVHPIMMPQGQTDPSVVYSRITEDSDYHMQSGSGLGTVRMQVDSWAQRQEQTNQLAGAVFDCLSGYRGDVNTGTEVVEVQGVFLGNGREDYDPVAKMFRMGRDYLMWYRER